MSTKKERRFALSKIQEPIIKKLEEAFSNDFTQQEACLFSGITDKTYKKRYDEDSAFRRRMDAAKAHTFFQAKINISKSIRSGNVDDSWKLLSKRQKDLYSDKIETNQPSTVQLGIIILPPRISSSQETPQKPLEVSSETIEAEKID